MLFWMSEFVEAVTALHDKPANNRGIESLSRKGCEWYIYIYDSYYYYDYDYYDYYYYYYYCYV